MSSRFCPRIWICDPFHSTDPTGRRSKPIRVRSVSEGTDALAYASGADLSLAAAFLMIGVYRGEQVMNSFERIQREVHADSGHPSVEYKNREATHRARSVEDKS